MFVVDTVIRNIGRAQTTDHRIHETRRATDEVIGDRRVADPGQPFGLDATGLNDALCRRFGINNDARTLHGALLDSEILAEVYLELIGGRQPDFALSTAQAGSTTQVSENWRPVPRSELLPPRLTEAEKAAHNEFIAQLGDNPLWLRR